MLRVYLRQQWFGLGNEGMDVNLHHSQTIRDFLGINMAQQRVPDAPALPRIRQLLQAHELTKKMFERINAILIERGLPLRRGFMVGTGWQLGRPDFSIHTSD